MPKTQEQTKEEQLRIACHIVYEYENHKGQWPEEAYRLAVLVIADADNTNQTAAIGDVIAAANGVIDEWSGSNLSRAVNALDEALQFAGERRPDGNEAEALDAIGVLERAVGGVCMFYAYEIATDTTYDMGAYLKEEDRDAYFSRFLENAGDEVETYATGTVWAVSPEQALNKVRAGKWEYTQKL